MQKWIQRWRIGAAVLLAGVALPTEGWATAFTLTDQISITGATSGNYAGLIATIDPVLPLGTALSGTLGITNGTIDFVNQDVFVVDITIGGGSPVALEEISISVLSTAVLAGLPFSSGGQPRGAGAFDDAGDSPPDTVLADPLVFPLGTGSGIFGFFTNNVVAGATTVRLFVAHDLGDMLIGQVVDFMINPTTTLANFTVTGEIIPEPGTLVLVGAGLTLLALRSRKRR